MRRFALAAVIASFLFLPWHAEAEIFDAAANFPSSPTLPPTSGVWSYGYSNILGGTFTPDTTATTNYFGNGDAIVGYYTPLSLSAPDLPTVLANETGSPYTISGIANWSPALLLMHPGESAAQGEYSIVQFVAPDSANYSLDAVFQGLDTAPTTTDVHILVNGAEIWGSSIDTYNTPTTYSAPASLVLNAGDTIDFEVGFGSNGFSSDSTGFDATIAESPEPGTFFSFLFGTTIALLITMESRRRGKTVSCMEKKL